MDFYDEIATQYDQITSATERAPLAKQFVELLVQRYRIKSALDVACGTGLYTLPLAAAGLRTAGSDVSAGMIDRARAEAQKQGLSIQWVQSPMQDLSGRVNERFDAVLCMGNSIPHLLEAADLDRALRGFVRLATAGGIIVIQLLNYIRILARQERIVSIDRQGDREYIRFYDFLEGLVQFNILEIHWKKEALPKQSQRACPEQSRRIAEHRLHQTPLKPYDWKTLEEALLRAGCRSVEVFTGPRLGHFDPENSETVVLVGKK